MSYQGYYVKKGGAISIDCERIRFGMVQLGKDMAPILPYKRFRLQIAGELCFKGECVISHHSFISISKNGYIEIGDKSSFSYCTNLICKERMIFGEKVRISWNCTFIDTDFHPLIDMISGKAIRQTLPLVIGNGVWIGHDCIISKGSRLADNITVSSGSVVKGKFKKQNSIIGGNLAKLLDEGYKRDDV